MRKGFWGWLKYHFDRLVHTKIGAPLMLLGKADKAISRFYCLLGLHAWAWNLRDVGYISLDGSDIPDCALCKHCGAKYKREE